MICSVLPVKKEKLHNLHDSVIDIDYRTNRVDLKNSDVYIVKVDISVQI